jgi:hypothetical protein
MEVAASTTVQTSGNAALTKNLAVAGNASVNTLALLGIQVRMAAVLNAAVTTVATIAIDKRVSGAGDEITTAVAAIRLTVNLVGGAQANASANTSVLYITKLINGYALAQVVIVNAHLRQLYLHSGLSSEISVSEAGASVESQDISFATVVGDLGFGAVDYTQISVFAELVDATVEAEYIQNTSAAVALETIEMQRVA